jgi:hypothetical protein
MSDTDLSLQTRNQCDCCDGISAATPVLIFNLPGQASLAYRVGDHSRFKASLQAGLSLSNDPSLRALKARGDGDFAIALLDAWATVGDVLTFYQERIANESYLRTATERRSLLELSRLIGYVPHPGSAASVYLAYQMEEAAGAPSRVTIAAGSQVQSVPEQDELPHIFETSETIEARVAWNNLRPPLKQFPVLNASLTHLVFEGTATGLRGGDGLLYEDSSQKVYFRIISQVTIRPDPHNPLVQNTHVQLTAAEFKPIELPADQSPVPPNDPPLPNLGETAAKLKDQTLTAVELNALAEAGNFQVQDVFDQFAAVRSQPPSVLVFRVKAAIFGHNAPPPSSTEKPERKADWVNETLNSLPDNEGDTAVPLDTTYPTIGKNSYALLKSGDTMQLFRVKNTTDVSLIYFTLSAKVTRLTFTQTGSFSKFKIRATSVYAQPERLRLVPEPITTAISDATVRLDGLVEGLRAGQTVIAYGELDNARGNFASEVVVLERVEHTLHRDGFTTLTFMSKLVHKYTRHSFRIAANVVAATHGETRHEIIGSGDARQRFQQFTLRQPPLTYRNAATPNGVESTLKVYVNEVQWQEVSSFYGHGSDERIYITRTDDEGKTTVIFGDGKAGARLPTGQENIRATYRRGLGSGGNVRAKQLSLMLTRPAGVREVSNPLPASGGDEPETRNALRSNASLTVMTMQRIVSLRDYEDFARAFAGVAKAQATWTWNGQRRGVFVTVAGPNGSPVGDDTFMKLEQVMQQAGDRFVALQVAKYQPVSFQIAADIRVKPGHQAHIVKPAVETALRRHFAFEARAFGQPVTYSEIVSVIHGVEGVAMVDVQELSRPAAAVTNSAPLNTATSGAGTSSTDELSLPPLLANMPKLGGSANALPAELLMLDPTLLKIEVLP